MFRHIVLAVRRRVRPRPLTRAPRPFVPAPCPHPWARGHHSRAPEPAILPAALQGTWGALGLSRKSCLMYKDLRFASLPELVKEFADSYGRCGHQLVKVYVGLPLPQAAAHSSAPIQWRVCKVRVDSFPWEEASAVLQRWSRAAMGCLEAYQRTGAAARPRPRPAPRSPPAVAPPRARAAGALPRGEFTLSRRRGLADGERPGSRPAPPRRRVASRASPIRQRAAVRNGE